MVVVAPWCMRLVQPIVYRGRLVACATRDRIFLSEGLERCAASDPELRFVLLMCCYAGDVLSGALPGPYSSLAARHYAQVALIPEELLERDALDVPWVARGLGLPADELRAARHLWSASRGGRRHA
jgi:hypothetical protein